MTWTPSAIIDSESLVGQGPPISVVNPANEEVIAEIPEADEALVQRAMTSARAAFERGDWRLMSVEERQRILRACADANEAAAAEIAESEGSYTGSPLAQIRTVAEIGSAS